MFPLAPNMAPAPQPGMLKPAELPMLRPAGSASVKPTPVSGTAFGFMIVKVRVEPPFTGITDGENALVMIGGATGITVLDAVVVTPVGPDPAVKGEPLMGVSAPVTPLIVYPETLPGPAMPGP